MSYDMQYNQENIERTTTNLIEVAGIRQIMPIDSIDQSKKARISQSDSLRSQVKNLDLSSDM